jgi:sulfate/thiosulfate transport system ATP-binding protein
VSISVRGVTKRYGTFVALNAVDLDVRSSEMVALLGPSGSGKTSLLRLIAGLEVPDSGTIQFHGEDATDRPVRERQVGFVFQHYALFRHLTVFENIAFGLRVRPRKERPSEEQIRARVCELLDLIQLDWLANHHPSQLSGGQRQRVALARALAIQPKVLLLDEPFGALDARVRKELRRWLRRLHDEVHVTSVFVTHDQEEAMEVADRVVVMNRGRIEQVGSPDEVYEAPATPFVVDFLGDVNLFHGRLERGRLAIGQAVVDVPEYAAAPDQPAVAYARAHELEIARIGDGSEGVEAVIRHVRLQGAAVRLELEPVNGSARLEAEISRARLGELGLQDGDHILVRPRRLRIFPRGPDNPP